MAHCNSSNNNGQMTKQTYYISFKEDGSIFEEVLSIVCLGLEG